MFRGRRNVAQEPNVLLVGSVVLTICLALLAGASHAADATNPMTPQPVPAQVPAKEGVAQIAKGKLFYWDTGGSGPAVILLHPATGSALMWVYQQPVFAKAGYRVIGYSRRGYYNSDPITKDNPGVAADDLHQLVELLSIQRFHAVSSAAGGSIATDYALSHPERLHSLVITSNSAGVRGGDIVRVSEGLRPKGFEDMPADFRELGPSYRAANPDGVKQWLELEHKAAPNGVVLQKLGNQITAASLKTIKVPTLLMTGDADLYTPPSLMRMVGAQIPDSEIEIVQETGHAIYWERPDVFNRVILDFIGRHSK